MTDMLRELAKTATPRTPGCTKCHGEGWYKYDHNHAKPCDACCPHTSARGLITSSPDRPERVGKWVCDEGCGTLLDEKREPPVEPEPDTALEDAVRQVLADHDLLVCGRVWEAWGHGTMGPDDFTRVEDDDRLIDSIVDELKKRGVKA